jgi:hypothetical protein
MAGVLHLEGGQATLEERLEVCERDRHANVRRSLRLATAHSLLWREAFSEVYYPVVVTDDKGDDGARQTGRALFRGQPLPQIQEDDRSPLLGL